ncbi:MAG TPA: SprT family zinc-dependent metalloprotease [bacterium]|nr:SprT family zinc-dependent metalloprotease [bacterium]
MEAQIQIGERSFPYRLQRSTRRRTVAISIHPEQGMVVYSPARLSGKGLEAMLLQKSAWILSKTQEAEQARAIQQTPRWHQGASVPYQGEWYTLRLAEEDPGMGVRLDGNSLLVPLPGAAPHSPEQVRHLVVSWYKREAAEVLGQRVEHFQELVRAKPTSLRVKEQKRRWGSCSPQGGLNFNWRLILAPPLVLDYVVVHELCHLHLLNHSRQFWELVGGVLPGYKEQKAWLRCNGPILAL